MDEHTATRLVKIAQETIALRDLARTAKARLEHLVADLGIIELACQVVDHSLNAALIHMMNEGDGVEPNIRAAFEAAQDLSFLAYSDDYDHFGCRLQAAEIIDRAHAFQLGRDYELARGMEPEPEDVDVEGHFDTDIAIWAKHQPDAREIYLKAVSALRADRARRKYHWSGLTRERMVAHIKERTQVEWLSEWNRGTYTFLSLGTHPSAGRGPTDVRISDDGTISYLRPDEGERELVKDVQVDCLLYSLRTARIGLAVAFQLGTTLEQMAEEFRVADQPSDGGPIDAADDAAL